MTAEQIAELRRLEVEAVKAPWIAAASSVVMPVEDFDISTPRPEEADLIAAARNALPRLLDEREALLEAMRLLVFETGQMYAPIAVLDAMRAAIAKAEAP